MPILFEGGGWSLSSPTALDHIRRVGRLWHYVLISRLIAFCAMAFYPGIDGALDKTVHWLGLLAGIACDLSVVTVGHIIPRGKAVTKRKAASLVAIALLGIGLGTLLTMIGVAAITAVSADAQHHDGFALLPTGLVLIAAAAATFSRPGFFIFATATVAGGAIGAGSSPLAIAPLALLLGLFAMNREDIGRQRRLLQANARQRAAQRRALNLVHDFEQSGQGWFWETDRHGQLVYVSASVAEKLGLPVGQIVGRAFTDIIRKRIGNDHNEERTLGFCLSSRTAFRELTVQAAVRGEERGWSVSGQPISNELGNFQGFRGSGSDLTDMKRSERAVNQLARYDTLTGLANRLQITELLERALRNHIGQPQPCAMFLLDLDRFKAVNDTLGHPVGDLLLQQVAGRLGQVIGDSGHVGRLGGDEFQIVLPQITQKDKLAIIASSIIQTLAKPFAIEGEQVRIGSSIGIAMSDGAGVPPSALVRNADLALYAAKDAGRGVYRFYADAMHEQASERKAIEDALRDALNQDQLQLLYQPIVDIANECITGFEALIRWNHPTRGTISPARFIPIAEEANLIVPIGDWVIRTACQAIATLGPDYRIAVNVSPRQFGNPGLPDIITSALAAAAIRPDQLELEITEGIFLDESPAHLTMFQTLKGIGVRLALDDFGTGYSALGYLKKVPFDKIKIDQSFVRGAADAGGMNAAIIASIVGLAAALKIDTTAEGVETHDELALVRRLGCSHVQGYIYGKPMELADATALLHSGDGRVAAEGYQSAREPRRRTFRTIAVESGGFRYEAIVRNLASRGALLEGLSNVPQGTMFTLDFGTGLAIDAQARWSIDNRMGVQFSRAVDVDKLMGGAGGTRMAQAPLLRPVIDRAA